MEISQLPKDQKKAVARAMLDLNYSTSEIANTLGVHRATVYRYGEQLLPEDLRQFATDIKILFSIKQHQIIAKILKRIEFAVDRTTDIRGLVTAFEAIKRHTATLYEIQKEHKHQEKWDYLLE